MAVRKATKPRRVVLVDADNPLEEVSGEFFWREDHERLLASARSEAFELGYSEGFRHSREAGVDRVFVRFRRRRSLLRIVMLVMVALVVGAYLLTLLAT